MATFGSRGKNKFPLPSVESGENYYTLVDSETGKITLKRINKSVPDSPIPGFSEGLDATVGTIESSGPNKGKFIPGGGATPTEVQALAQQPQTITKIRNQAQITADNGGATNAQKLIFPDAASAPANPDPSSDPKPVPLSSSNETIKDLFKSIESGASEGTVRSRLAAIDVRYPEKLDDKTQDSIVFRLKEIKGRDFSGTNNLDTNFSFGAKALSDEFGRVILPIQPSISDSNGVDWGGSTLDPLSAYAGRASLAIQQSEGQVTQAIIEQLKLAAEQFKTNYGTYAKAINLYLAQEAVGAQGLFSRATGAILNPNLELLFNGPTLRSFNFTFRLSPRSEGEAKKVKDIIYFFKAGMAVRTANVGVFLKAPYVFSIKYCSGPSSQHKSLNKIRDCALLGCDVDYTPDGSYMTFNDEEKTITSYQLTLRFGELDPLYNDFYADSHPIGF
ncbi:MAG: hypothetical protein ACO3H5_07435 [Candidatus Nanopelagicales bacterium]